MKLIKYAVRCLPTDIGRSVTIAVTAAEGLPPDMASTPNNKLPTYQQQRVFLQMWHYLPANRDISWQLYQRQRVFLQIWHHLPVYGGRLEAQ